MCNDFNLMLICLFWRSFKCNVQVTQIKFHGVALKELDKNTLHLKSLLKIHNWSKFGTTGLSIGEIFSHSFAWNNIWHYLVTPFETGLSLIGNIIYPTSNISLLYVAAFLYCLGEIYLPQQLNKKVLFARYIVVLKF